MTSFGSVAHKRKQQGHCLKPRLVLERSFVNSVTELVCSSMPNQPNVSSASEKVEWVAFADECDLSDKSIKKHLEKLVGPDLPIIIIIGYSYGYQIWALLNNGECEELLSVRDVPANCVRFLPQPKIYAVHEIVDSFAEFRPLIAVSNKNGSSQLFSVVNIVSLRNDGDPVKRLTYEQSVINILTSDRAMIIMFLDKMLVINCYTFEEQFWIRNCNNDLNPNSASLSLCFLAFPDNTLNHAFQSCGGASTSEEGSYTSQVVLAAKNLSKTVSEISVSLASSLTGQKPKVHSATPRKCDSKEKTEGVVTVVHVDYVRSKEFDTQSAVDSSGILCHFVASADEPVSTLKFNPNGSLLLTCGPSGHRFDVFQILTHPSSPCLGAVQHLYVLQRGSTVAKILNIAFSLDSRWVAVSSANGTTHIFPITPYGGSINVRTHTGPRVVNRESRFHRSAGLDSLDHSLFAQPTTSQTLHSPSKSREQHPVANHVPHASLYRAASNPRLPPFASPLTLLAASKVKQSPTTSLFAAGLGDAATTAADEAASALRRRVSSSSRRRTPPGAAYRWLAAVFAAQRCGGIGAPSSSSSTSQGGNSRNDLCSDSLYILRCNGQLNEHQLSVKPFCIGARICEENQVELHVIPTVEWPLSRCKADADTCLPLPEDHLLLQAVNVKRLLGTYTTEPKNASLNRDLWISQVEMVTYSGPHRRLWMGPQFTFKTYLDLQRSAPLVYPSLPGKLGLGRSEPISIGSNAPPFGSSTHSVPVIIEASSVGSFDQQQHQQLSNAVQLRDVCGGVWSSDNDFVDDTHGGLRRCIAEAMLDQRPRSSLLEDGAATDADVCSSNKEAKGKQPS